MKKIITSLFFLLFAVFFSGNVNAQDKALTRISSVKQQGQTVRFSLTSSKPFIFGSNRYVLTIGNKDFFLNEQSHDNGTGLMTFFIPQDDFKGLAEGANIYITYGQVNKELDNLEDLAKGTNRCWSLGKFSQSLLTK